MREFLIEDGVMRTLHRLRKKDPVTYLAALKKIDEIIQCADVNQYKNLRRPLQAFKRVHINGPFVLTFKYVLVEDKVYFFKLDHHDTIYEP